MPGTSTADPTLCEPAHGREGSRTALPPPLATTCTVGCGLLGVCLAIWMWKMLRGWRPPLKPTHTPHNRRADATAVTACPPAPEATASNAISKGDETGAAEASSSSSWPEAPASLALVQRIKALGLHLGDIYVSGISLGLPNGGSDRKVFDPRAIVDLFDGKNMIENLPPEMLRAQLDRNVVQIRKGATGERLRRPLSALHEVVQLASRIGEFDLAGEFGIDSKMVETLDTTYALAVGAGLQALQDAGLVPAPPSTATAACASTEAVDSTSTKNGSNQHMWQLHESLSSETGVIFASSFPALDSLVDEVSRFMKAKIRAADARQRADLADQLEALAQRLGEEGGPVREMKQAVLAAQGGCAEQSPIDHAPEPQRVEAAGSTVYTAVAAAEGELKVGGDEIISRQRARAITTHHNLEEPYEFNRKLLFKLLVMANSQLAEIIAARGPNLHINAACAGTTAAIALACDWMRAGKCSRVVVISADNPSSANLLPWIGTGFLALGAASTQADVANAALPFDRKRNGMILGAGAVGMVLETDVALRRCKAGCAGVCTARCADDHVPRARVLAALHANSAFHASAIGTLHATRMLESLLVQVETVHAITRDELASSLLYVSHETCTYARGGGCAGAEMASLRSAFGASVASILITNTKGITGHAMGVCFEDAVAVAALSEGLLPPVVNFKEADPALGALNLSRGGHHDAKYALHFAAGFGSQVAYVLYARV